MRNVNLKEIDRIYNYKYGGELKLLSCFPQIQPGRDLTGDLMWGGGGGEVGGRDLISPCDSNQQKIYTPGCENLLSHAALTLEIEYQSSIISIISHLRWQCEASF